MKLSRLLLWLTVLVFSSSGIALHLIAPAEGDLPHPLNGLLREIHGISAMLGIFMFGYMIAEHVQKKLAKRKYHWDGLVHLGLWILLSISGLMLYYPPEWMQENHIVLSHWYVGIALILCFPFHYWRKKIRHWLSSIRH